MVQVLVLLPVLIALALLNWQSPARVAMKVYLPCLLMVPMYMDFKLGGLAVNAVSFLSLVLAAAGLWACYRTLRFTVLDALVICYSLSAFYSDAHKHALNVGVYMLLWSMSKCIFPYLIGRTLIEQTGMRVQFSRTLVLCLAAVALLGLWEFRMQTNLFQMTEEKLTGLTSLWGRQARWGFGRVAGPYGTSIMTGMVFTTGLLLQLWLVGTKNWGSFKALSFISARRKPLLITLCTILGLLIAQSRGPWIGCVFGLIVASIGFAKNRRRAAVFSLTGLVIAVAVTSVVLNKYTDVDEKKTTDRDQLNASYRRNLYASYEPMIEIGGLWGWGSPDKMYRGVFAWAPNQPSIDNEYLRIAMLQGYVGLFIFVTLIGFTLAHLIRLCARFRDRDDILFTYCMLGIIVAMSFTLTTVFLGDVVMQLLFLLVGWTRSIQPTSVEQEKLAPVAARDFEFERVFV